MKIVLKKSRTLWQTRGKAWDYSFISKPILDNPNVEQRWYDINQLIFPTSLVDDPSPIYRYGKLECGSNEELNFCSVELPDPYRKDPVGRPIRHYIAIFPEERSPVVGWADSLISTLSNELSRIIETDRPVQLADFEIEIDAQVLSANIPPEHIHLRPQAAAYTSTRVPAPSALPQPSSSSPKTTVVATIMALIFTLIRELKKIFSRN